jgi:hypothetical protein
MVTCSSEAECSAIDLDIDDCARIWHCVDPTYMRQDHLTRACLNEATRKVWTCALSDSRQQTFRQVTTKVNAPVPGETSHERHASQEDQS